MPRFIFGNPECGFRGHSCTLLDVQLPNETSLFVSTRWARSKARRSEAAFSNLRSATYRWKISAYSNRALSARLLRERILYRQVWRIRANRLEDTGTDSRGTTCRTGTRRSSKEIMYGACGPSFPPQSVQQSHGEAWGPTIPWGAEVLLNLL